MNRIVEIQKQVTEFAKFLPQNGVVVYWEIVGAYGKDLYAAVETGILGIFDSEKDAQAVVSGLILKEVEIVPGSDEFIYLIKGMGMWVDEIYYAPIVTKDGKPNFHLLRLIAQALETAGKGKNAVRLPVVQAIIERE